MSRPRGLVAIVILGVLGTIAIWTTNSLYGDIFRQYTNTQAGTYSDFSQRWLGTRVALLEGGNPYSPAMEPRIQLLYYGHVLQADDPHRPSDPQAFDYPLYLVWLIWPLALLPFPLAAALFKLLAVLLLTAGTYAYLTMLGWPGPGARLVLAGGCVVTLAGQAIVRNDQLTVVVYGLLLAAVYAAWKQYFAVAGVLLALAWIKPQLALLLTVGLVLWAGTGGARRRLLAGAAGTAVLLLVSTEWLLPGWIGAWGGTLGNYAATTSGFQGLASYRLIDWIGLALRGGLGLATLAIWWRVRQAPLGDLRVQVAIAMSLVVTTAVQQPWYTYNLVLLYPPLLLLVAHLTGRPLASPLVPPRGLGWIAVTVFAAPWVVYTLLAGAYLVQLVPAQGLAWPSFAGLVLVTERVVINATILTLLFAYVAWSATLFAAGPAANNVAAGA